MSYKARAVTDSIGKAHSLEAMGLTSSDVNPVRNSLDTPEPKHNEWQTSHLQDLYYGTYAMLANRLSMLGVGDLESVRYGINNGVKFIDNEKGVVWQRTRVRNAPVHVRDKK